MGPTTSSPCCGALGGRRASADAVARWAVAGPAPAQQTILQIEPLGNGAGVALVSDDDEARQRVLRALDQRALSARRTGLADPQLGPLEELESGASGVLMFAHLSSNQRGDLLVQLGGFDPVSDRIWIRSAQQETRVLDLEPSGAQQLLPDGGGLVMPSYDGLELLSLDARDAASTDSPCLDVAR